MAAFARGSFTRLWLVQFIFAIATAAVVVWFLHEAWFPKIREAIRHLPAEGEIRVGNLSLTNDSPRTLAEGHFLAFSLDAEHSGQERSSAHLQVEFGKNDCRVISFLGYAEFPYPKSWIIAFNQPELEPKWGAWAPPILGITALAVMAELFVSWSALAAIYFLPVWLVGFFANRDLNLGGSWRLAGAALMPGALLMVAGILFYGFGVLDLLQLSIVFAVHFVVGWIYFFISPFFLPRHASLPPTGGNPFAGGQKKDV